MKMKKVLALVLVILVVSALGTCLFACNPNDDTNEIELAAYEGLETPDYSTLDIPGTFKLGLICLHGEESTYDKNFIDAAKQAIADLGLSQSNLIIKTGIPEDATCATAAAELVDAGCNVVFADSFGHESFIAQVAQANPTVQFCHATGTTAHTANIANLHNAFASIYEGRYLAGIAAGMKLNEMIEAGKFTAAEAKMGYVGAYTYAEVISGYTSFYLGAKSVCPTVTMDVQFTGSWYDVTAEKTAAEALINRGCKLISQHADSMGAPSACEEAGIPNVSYNGSTFEACPNTFIVSSRINWAPYFKYIIAQTVKGEAIEKDWTGTLKTGSVVLTNLGGKATPAGAVDAIKAARTKLANGELNVFDTNNFTVTVKIDAENYLNSLNANAVVDENGKLITYMADVDSDANFTGDTQVVADGVFQESKFRSAPYFDIRIDGITLLNDAF
ncbi:BMP family ABC transporter substrate-binding protein [bacterium]|nr:BMP family ABC transporter substrate-binding protein [bacterium]